MLVKSCCEADPDVFFICSATVIVCGKKTKINFQILYFSGKAEKVKEEGKMERQKKYKNCVKNSQKELRFENKFVIIAVHGSKNRRRGGLQ